VLEDAVIAHILEKADISEKKVSYEELFKAPETGVESDAAETE